jgi:hypothetical protein
MIRRTSRDRCLFLNLPEFSAQKNTPLGWFGVPVRSRQFEPASRSVLHAVGPSAGSAPARPTNPPSAKLYLATCSPCPPCPPAEPRSACHAICSRSSERILPSVGDLRGVGRRLAVRFLPFGRRLVAASDRGASPKTTGIRIWPAGQLPWRWGINRDNYRWPVIRPIRCALATSTATSCCGGWPMGRGTRCGPARSRTTVRWFCRSNARRGQSARILSISATRPREPCRTFSRLVPTWSTATWSLDRGMRRPAGSTIRATTNRKCLGAPRILSRVSVA